MAKRLPRWVTPVAPLWERDSINGKSLSGEWGSIPIIITKNLEPRDADDAQHILSLGTVQIMRLWNRSLRGTFLSGKLGAAKILVYPNYERACASDATHILCIGAADHLKRNS